LVQEEMTWTVGLADGAAWAPVAVASATTAVAMPRVTGRWNM
jgi:hypothetical protein